MTKLRALGFAKIAIDKNVSLSSNKISLPKTTNPTDIKVPRVEINPDKDLKNYIDKHNPSPKPMKPTTVKILKSISKDLNAYTKGDTKIWNRRADKIKKNLKDPKKVVGAGAGIGLYLASKKNPKLENFMNLVSDRKINFINKPKQRLSLKVPTSKDGTWRLNWSKAF